MTSLDKNFIASADGLRLFVRSWEANHPKALVVLMHGLGEHIGRYDHLAAFFNQQDITVVGFDHRGHGSSEGKRGHIPSFESVYEDIDKIVSAARSHHPGLPVFLYAHSMGANLLLNYMLHRQSQIKGAIVTGSFIRLAFEPSPFVVALGKAMRSIFPGFTQSNQLDPNDISRDPAVVQAYKNDPLVHDRLTASLGTRLLDGAANLDKFDGTFPCPLLIMHGADDKITSPKGSKAFADRVKGDITHLEWPGLYHEIHNEKSQKDVFQYTIDWIFKHLS